MKPTAYVTHSDCSLHDAGWAHPEHQGRLGALARAVYRDMLTLHTVLVQVDPEPASPDDLLLVHSKEYVERVRAASEAAERAGSVQEFGPAGRISGRTWDAARAAVGAGLSAVDAVLEGSVRNAFCAVRPPGSDVGRDGGEGYGIFNTAAAAAMHLRRRHKVASVLVVEIGTGPGAGRGTAEIAARDAGIRFAIVHQASNPPPDWPPGTTAVAVDPVADGTVVQQALESLLSGATAGLSPDFLILSLGLEMLAGDPIGGLAVDPREVHGLTDILVTWADETCGGRLISALEGGYQAGESGAAVVQHLRSLSGLPPA